MNNLLNLIHNGENESVEFKGSLRLKEAVVNAVSILSYSNSSSGQNM